MTGREEVFQQAMNRGHSAAWDQDWEQAASFYREALIEFPANPLALASLGLALTELEQYDEALQVYSLATEYSPEDPALFDRVSLLSEQTGNRDSFLPASLRAAELYLHQQEVEKAIECLSRVARFDPENLEAHSRLAVIYERLGRKQQAVAEYMAVASLFQRDNDLERAVQAVDRALLISPNSNEVQHALFMLKESRLLPKPTRSRAATGPLSASPSRGRDKYQPKPGEASTDPVSEGRNRALAELAGLIFEEENGEGLPDAKKRSGRWHQKIGAGWIGNNQRYDRAAIVFHLSQAIDLQGRSQTAQAGEELEKTLGAGLENAAIFFCLGFLFEQAGQLDKAEHYLKIATRYEDYALAARLLLGQILLQNDRLEDAALEYLEALKLADAQVVPVDQAEVLQKLYGPLIEAEAKNSDRPAKAMLCESISGLLMRGDWREQLAESRRELLLESEDSAPIPLGELLTETRSNQIIRSISTINRLARAGHLRSAMEEALFALLHAPTYLPLHILLGEILLQGDHVPEAVEKFRIVAQVYGTRGEIDRAIDLLHRVIRIAPMDIEARKRLIDLLLKRGDIDAAVREHVGVADVYYSLADLNRARETYNDALRLAREAKMPAAVKVQILHQVADIEIQLLDWRGALQIYEQIRELDADDRRARANLVQLNLRLGQGSQAMAELKDYLSYLFEQGRQDLAIPFVEELVSENPEYEHLQRLLADLQNRAG